MISLYALLVLASASMPSQPGASIRQAVFASPQVAYATRGAREWMAQQEKQAKVASAVASAVVAVGTGQGEVAFPVGRAASKVAVASSSVAWEIAWNF